jgi:hypothetical protein
MADLSVRSDSVDVEQIMRQIRERIREKRGVDYTEAEIQQLANVKLEKFLDPRGVRSDLVEQFKKHHVISPTPPNYEFEDMTLYETHRGLLRFIRKLLNPVLKLFFNPNKIVAALHIQSGLNTDSHRRSRQREEMDQLYFEVIHNLVVEATRLGVEVHNLKMRVESLSSRMDFDERRGRSLESVVQYKRPERRPQDVGSTGSTSSPGAAGSPSQSPQTPRPVEAGAAPPRQGGEGGGQQRPWAEGQGQRPDGARRRRRRRRRRPGQNMGDRQNTGGPAGDAGGPSGMSSPAGSGSPGGDDGGPDFEPDNGASDQ